MTIKLYNRAHMQDSDLKGKEAHQLTIDDLKHVRAKLDERSHAHCLAKWFQVTLNLHNGRSASCCLQPSKMIDVTLLKEYPDVLHNGAAHVEDRLRMRAGEKVSSCGVCWESEADGNLSERVFKSSDDWAFSNLERADGNAENVTPTYIEVSFSHQCQLRCSYCNPETSSSIAAEIGKHGAYPDRLTEMGLDDRLRKGTLPWEERYPDSENPYVKAFWFWLPKIYSQLKVLRLTGGEPFLTEDTFRFIEYVKLNPNPSMELQFNSNLSFPVSVFERFTREFKQVPETNYKRVTFFASLDSWGERAEYIRFGLRVNSLIENMERLLNEFPNLELRVTSTISLLAVYGLKDLLENIIKLKAKYGRERIILSIYPLIFPTFQSIRLIPEKTYAELKSVLAFSLEHNEHFLMRETQMLSNLLDSSKHPFEHKERLRHMADFYRFFHEYDRRKQTNFLKTFPEYTDLWKEAQVAHRSEIDQWLLDVQSNAPDVAVFACHELMRINPNELESQMALAQRLSERDPLSLEHLLKPKRLHLRTLEVLQSGALRPERAGDVITLLVKRDPHLRELEACLSRALVEATTIELGRVIPVWRQYALNCNVDSKLWNQLICKFIEMVDEVGRYELAERLLAVLIQGQNASSLKEKYSSLAPIFCGGSSAENWYEIFNRRDLIILPRLALVKIEQQAEHVVRALIDVLKCNSLTDVMLQAFKEVMTSEARDEFFSWVAKCEAERFYDIARIVKECELDEPFFKLVKNRLDIGAAIFEQLKLAGLSVPASSILDWLSEFKGNVPWKWLKSALTITNKSELAQLIDNELTTCSYVSMDERAKFLFEILNELPLAQIETTSVFALDLKGSEADFSSWWKALHFSTTNEDAWHVVKLRPSGEGKHPLCDIGQLCDVAKVEITIEILKHNSITELFWTEWSTSARWELLERALREQVSLPRLAQLTLEHKNDEDWVGRLADELEHLEGGFEYTTLTPWPGRALEIWAAWSTPDNLLKGIESLNESRRYIALRAHGAKAWNAQQWSSLFRLSYDLTLYRANLFGGESDLIAALKITQDQLAWSFLRDLDQSHRTWMLVALSELIYSFKTQTAQEAWSWLALYEADYCASLVSQSLPPSDARWSMLASLKDDTQISWACELLVRENDEKKRGAIADWLLERDFVLQSDDRHWLCSDESKRVYVAKSSTEQLFKILSEIDFRILELWLDRQSQLNEKDLLKWYQLDTRSWTFIFENFSGTIQWKNAFKTLPLEKAFEFLRGLKRPNSLISSITELDEALIVHGEWLSQYSESAPIFARAIRNKSIGDHCFSLWEKHAPCSSELAFSSLWHRFSTSADDDYLADKLLVVAKFLDEKKLVELVIPGSDDRSQACFVFLMKYLENERVAVMLLQKWWESSSCPVDILYAASESGVFKGHHVIQWAITKFAKAIDNEDNSAWNLVDILIQNKADRALLLKLSSMLLSLDQTKSSPGMKFLAYATGRINNVSDF